MKIDVLNNRKILLLIGILSAFYLYQYIDRHVEASFTEEDFSAFSEMKNIFQNMKKNLSHNNPDCDLERISFTIRNDVEFTAYLHCKNGLRSIDIHNNDLRLRQVLSNYKIMWISIFKNSDNKLEDIFFYKKIPVIYTSNIYNANACDVKIVNDITRIPDENIEVCKSYCEKLKYQKSYLYKIIEEDKSLF